MTERENFLKTTGSLFGMCDLMFWYGETYWRAVNGESQDTEFPELDWDDFSIVNAYWSMLSLLLLYAEKEGFARLGLDGLDDSCGVLGFTDPVVDSGIGNVIESAWGYACDRYGYEYPENMNFSPRAGYDIIECSPCVNRFEQLEHRMQVSLAGSAVICENFDGLSPEEYLEKNFGNVEESADGGDFSVYCLVNTGLWDLQKKIRAAGLDLSTAPGLYERYRHVVQRIAGVCDASSDYADGDTFCLDDGREVSYSIVEALWDEGGYSMLTVPILTYANVMAIFSMAEIDAELRSVAEEIDSMIRGKEAC